MTNVVLDFARLLMKVALGIMNSGNIQLAKANPNDGTNSMQASNQDTQASTPSTGAPGPEDDDDPNHKDEGIRDVTAESKGQTVSHSPLLMRTRSRHSSTIRSTKDGSAKITAKNKAVLGNHTYLASTLTDFKNEDGKYNGIIRLITADYLKYCYSLIKSKPGNMTRGTTAETLDRINDK